MLVLQVGTPYIPVGRLVFRRKMLFPTSELISVQKMKAVFPPPKRWYLPVCKSTRHYNPEDQHRHHHLREKIRSHMLVMQFISCLLGLCMYRMPFKKYFAMCRLLVMTASKSPTNDIYAVLLQTPHIWDCESGYALSCSRHMYAKGRELVNRTSLATRINPVPARGLPCVWYFDVTLFEYEHRQLRRIQLIT